MNIPVEIVAALFTAILALQAWILIEVVRMKIKVALLMQRVFHDGAKEDESDE